MNITLVDYTSNADEILIFAKKTRLNMSPSLLHSLKEMSEEDKQKELDYVFGTIGSAWEFVDYIFLIEDVTRAFTHQLVRHRVGVSFAQQSQRTVNVSEGFNYLETGDCEDNPEYEGCMEIIRQTYKNLISDGIKPEDARGLLPTNILTNILVKINLRALSEMLGKRLCERTQGEFRAVAEEMKKLVVKFHPWAEKILQPCCIFPGYCPFKNYKDCWRKKNGSI